MTGRKLIVMRHAKAEPFASTDVDRRLTERGRADAAEAGSFLAGIGTVPDHAVVSAAVRARETWAAVAAASGSAAELVIEGALFSAGTEQVLEALRRVPAEAERVMLIGHNPAVTYLVHLLEDGHGEPAAVDEMLRGYPPAALTVFDVDAAWQDLGPETGRVVDFHVGRG